ncbi:Glycine betaine/L-proline transport system permease protein ProW [Pseudovibrio axinellae]|uniref:Glycine betaine/L-proline transport system permease protein ProW n=1 Tax=Pseudovibrio axinellae TaxID=989403 RepID=A0A165X397_9HYPH|nr:proline/glycine betaine ABC transporter permease [Pseudovibrio axinellae]KZL17306.1 Glycine betaine/L-proline transport system permease protein ProW [Pseudovibrio axinellae]SEQ19593.1 glycine betaine/proline transport system permease protein [Pseudovibrio axinellae]
MEFNVFPNFGKPIKDGVNQFVEYLVVNYGDATEAFSDSLLYFLVKLERLLRGTDPIYILVIVALIAYVASRKISLSLLVVAGMWFIGAIGLWSQAMQTVAILLVAVFISIVIGIPLGVISARADRFRALLNPVLDLMQTIPSFVYLIPAAMLFGLGKVPAILATVIYAVPPLIRLTDLGIRHVDSAVVEASRAFGATRGQILRDVQIPLALPSIMQGINQTLMMALAMVVIASMIGARGVGETVLLGLQRNDAGTGLLGGMAIVVLAVVFDRITQAAGQRMQAHRKVTG